MDIGDFLLQYKEEHHMGNEKLALKLGICKPTLLSILRKELVPTVTTCKKIADSTGIKFSEAMRMREYTTKSNYKSPPYLYFNRLYDSKGLDFKDKKNNT